MKRRTKKKERLKIRWYANQNESPERSLWATTDVKSRPLVTSSRSSSCWSSGLLKHVSHRDTTPPASLRRLLQPSITKENGKTAPSTCSSWSSSSRWSSRTSAIRKGGAAEEELLRSEELLLLIGIENSRVTLINSESKIESRIKCHEQEGQTGALPICTCTYFCFLLYWREGFKFCPNYDCPSIIELPHTTIHYTRHISLFIAHPLFFFFCNFCFSRIKKKVKNVWK